MKEKLLLLIAGILFLLLTLFCYYQLYVEKDLKAFLMMCFMSMFASFASYWFFKELIEYKEEEKYPEHQMD